MKYRIAIFATLALAAGWLHADGLRDDEMGLSKTSVYDDPAPPEFAYSTLDPKQSGVLPRFWDEAPPQIPHRVDKFLPIHAKLNKCVECHDDPDAMGKKVKGKPTAMPETHYLKQGGELVMSSKRYVCTLCHVPQAGVEALVGNTYGVDR